MFEDLQILFDSFVAYKEGAVYRYKPAPIQLEYWAEDKAFKLENESINKEATTISMEIAEVDHPRFYQKHLLNSINYTLGKDDINAVINCHRYFDYNLNFIDRT